MIAEAGAQAVTLNANGPGNTYELINSVLAPGYDVVENPECVHPAFGRHIAEVFDTDLNTYVFEFYSHVAEDNDRCINFDRERVEIKTYDQSPANLIGTLNETITYKWKFRLAAGFQPSSSFTHIHQIKPVGGDDGTPLFTLTPRKGSPNKLELIHDNTTKVAIVDLSLFSGVWVEATEIVKVGAHGTYSITIKRVSDNATILSYSSSDIMTIRPDNDFIRPKWGIYRSLNNAADLRDESIRFNAFSIEEGTVVLPVKLLSFKAALNGNAVKIKWITANEMDSKNFTVEKSTDGVNYSAIKTVDASGNSSTKKSYEVTDEQPAAGKNFYRLKQTDIGGRFTYSDVDYIFFKQLKNDQLLIYPNPVKDRFQINIQNTQNSYAAVITNSIGQHVFSGTGTVLKINDDISKNIANIKPGVYFINLVNSDANYRGKFLKN
ncbi:MAG: T9SS type A sorting domain-containing protein [Ferruginibacter sp.]